MTTTVGNLQPFRFLPSGKSSVVSPIRPSVRPARSLRGLGFRGSGSLNPKLRRAVTARSAIVAMEILKTVESSSQQYGLGCRVQLRG